jgi:hypothetical protein
MNDIDSVVLGSNTSRAESSAEIRHSVDIVRMGDMKSLKGQCA